MFAVNITVKPLKQIFNYFNKALSVKHFSTSNVPTSNITLDGQVINYIKVGEGSKILLCFPGALGSIWTDFKPQVEKLDRNKFTIVAWDPPGYGLSCPPQRKFTRDFYENDADSANKFMNAIGHSKFSLLGWSDGGISSMILASKYPNSVESLIVWGANAYIVKADIEQYEKIRDVKKWSERARAPMVKMYTEEGFQKLWNEWCDILIHMWKKNGDICREKVREIRCPTLILHGDKDPMVAEEHPFYLHANIKESKLYRFPDGKHNIHLRYADKFNEIVTNFLIKRDI